MKIEHEIICKLDKESIEELPFLLKNLDLQQLFFIKHAIFFELQQRRFP